MDGRLDQPAPPQVTAKRDLKTIDGSRIQYEETTTSSMSKSIVSGTFEEVEWRVFRMCGQGHCRIQTLHDTIDEGSELNEEVIILSTSMKQQLLSGGSDILLQGTPHGKSLAQKLNSIDGNVAGMFGSKTEAISDAPLRLLKPRYSVTNDLRWDADKSFIALSYCWHNRDWFECEDRAWNDDERSEHMSTIPISRDMLQGLLLERVYPAEGVWIDQLCINQYDEQEKKVAIGSMDVIYKSARIVVVVLEDVQINEDEEQVLRTLIDKYEKKALFDLRIEIELSRAATSLLWKIFSARWFSRAWCSHELHVSNNQVFLIRMGSKDDRVRRILRITAEFIHDLSLIEADFVSFFAGAEQFLSLKKAYNRRRVQYNKFIYDRLVQRSELLKPLNTIIHDTTQIPSYMRIFAEIFALSSSVISDKLVIALNVSGCGLYFKGSAQTESECCELFTFVALAAGDPTTLCSSGDKIRISGNDLSWMHWPQSGDTIEPFLMGARHRRLDYVPSFDSKRLTMDAFFLADSEAIYNASEACRTKADWFIRGCIEMRAEEAYSFFDESDLLSPSFPFKKQLYINTLASVLECGKNWIISGVQSKGSLPTDDLLETAFKVIFEENNMEAVHRNDWNILKQNPDLFTILLEVLDGLFGAWLPEKPSDWGPAIFQIGPDSRNKLLTMCPQNEEYQLIIPGLLLHEKYDFQNRIWVVKKSCDGFDDGWTVIGKTRSFGTVDFVRACQMGDFRQHQRFVG